MNKFVRVLITGVFLTGIIASVICLNYAPRIAMGSCHDSSNPFPAESDSCLSHCLKQKISPVNLVNKISIESSNQGWFFGKIFMPANIQTASVIPTGGKNYYINQPIIKLNTSQIYSAPFFSHSPPIIF